MYNTIIDYTLNSVKYAHLLQVLYSKKVKAMIMKFNDMSTEEQNKVLCEARECIQNTGFNYTMALINGKYKMSILYTIAQFEVIRWGEMQRYIKGISFKTLSTNLKELERDGLVHREEYPQIPPKVEYSLTDKGKTLIPILNDMCAWGYENKEE